MSVQFKEDLADLDAVKPVVGELYLSTGKKRQRVWRTKGGERGVFPGCHSALTRSVEFTAGWPGPPG